MWTSLAADLDKKRRILTARSLMEKYESIIFNIAPCWLASPEAVSSVFPLRRNLFDYVIFDEASQSAVERSLTSLYRGNHIVIMGDEKQLRPFDLFRLGEEDEEEQYEDNADESMLSESLLVLARRTYGNRHLVWHYRSKYQELIDFSNHAFYDGHLQVAPNILRSPDAPPIRWIKCENGLWADRQNIPESSVVIDVIKDILKSNEDSGIFRSIGVITFNETQKTIILDEIDRRRNKDLELDKLIGSAENPVTNNLDDKLFVKNIENVQGDERDIIIFSVGYARDSDGNLRIMFGSLNKEGGENRLNVAITRARQEIIVVCSIEPDELKTDIAKNNGPKRLKDYLQYAKFTSESKIDDIKNVLTNLNEGFLREEHVGNVSSKTLLFESSFEELIYDRLKRLDYQVDSQIGYSGYRIDLAVVHPDDPSRYIMGIECDGAMFHSAKSTRERDVLRQEFLENRGWVIERIWSTNWWRNPDREIERIRQRIESLRSAESEIIKKE
jgi:Superfamily I DNA and RNA helicases and helicase subunits